MIEADLKPGPLSYHELVDQHRKLYAQLPIGFFGPTLRQVFDLGPDMTFYNPSPPFHLNPSEDKVGAEYQFFRVEPLSCEDSYVAPLMIENGLYRPVHEFDRLRLEDPTVVQIQGKNILIGVEVWSKPTIEFPKGTSYRNVFYEIVGNFEYKKIGEGPNGMKGIKLIDLGSDGIGVMTRPHLDQRRRGVLAFQIIDNLNELTSENLLMGNIVSNQVPDGNWVGVNEMHLLPNGKIGVLGHVAYEDEWYRKHYAAMTFQYDWKTHLATPIKVVATVDDFPVFEPKTQAHEDVIYPCSLQFDNSPYATLLASLGDARYGSTRIYRPW